MLSSLFSPGEIQCRTNASAASKLLGCCLLINTLVTLPAFGGPPQYIAKRLDSPFSWPWGTPGGVAINQINSLGQFCGSTGAGISNGYFYNGTFHLLSLGGLPNTSDGVAIALNDAGQVTGYAVDARGTQSTYLYNGGTGVITSVSPSDSMRSAPIGIDQRGRVIGNYSYPSPNSGSFRPFYYDGTTHVLGGFGGQASEATAFNNQGQIVGYAENQFRARRAFLYNSNTGTMLNLGAMISGSNQSIARGVNNRGQVYGISDGAGAQRHVFFYDGTMKDVGTFGGQYSFAYALNEAGQLVGSADATNGLRQAFLYDGTSSTRINIAPMNSRVSDGLGITDEGFVYGSYVNSDRRNRGFVYDGTTRDIGSFGGSDTNVLSMNGNGVVVGNSYLSGNIVANAFLYQGNTLFNLNNLLVNSDPSVLLSSATSINDAGYIAAYGSYQGRYTTYLLMPVPEAGSIALLVGLCLIGALVMRRRSRQCRHFAP